jgi:hypothetical protein
VPFDAVVSAVTSFTNSGAPDVAITGEYGDVTVYLNTRDF